MLVIGRRNSLLIDKKPLCKRSSIAGYKLYIQTIFEYELNRQTIFKYAVYANYVYVYLWHKMLVILRRLVLPAKTANLIKYIGCKQYARISMKK